MTHEEYVRRRAVWRYVNNLAGPKQPPRPEDLEWINSVKRR